MSIARSWQRFHAIDAQGECGLGEDLSGPASEADLAALQATGLPIPSALIESLRIHDGESDHACGWLANGGRLLSAAGMLAHREMQRDAFADDEGDDPEDDDPAVGIGPVRAVGWNEAWLPIADCNGDVTWYLDFDPLPGGTPGQVIRVDLECSQWIVCANGYAEFIEDYVDALESDEVGFEDPDEDDDGLERCGPWPPLERIPYLAPDVLDAGRLHAVIAAGLPDAAQQLAQHCALSPAETRRLEARVQAAGGQWKKALKALDALRAGDAENADDRWLRLDVLEALSERAALQIELDAAIAAAPSARLHARRADYHHERAGRSPDGKSGARLMEWLAGPAGQQHSAVCLERAIADYRAAHALQPRQRWRLAEAECLLEMARWEEAEAVYLQVIEALEARAGDPHAQRRLADARDGLERARNQDVDAGDSMLESLDQLLDLLAATGGGSSTGELREMRATFSGLRDAEREEAARRSNDPGKLDADARQIAAQIAGRHADTTERYAPYDAATLDTQARRYYDGARRALEALGFEWLADVEPLRNTEASGNRVLLRVMRSQDRSIAAAIFRMSNAFNVVEVIELESWLAAGRVLLTGNTGAANPFAAPATIEQQALPQGTPAVQLLDAHRRRLVDAGPVRPFDDVDAVYALQEHQRIIKREHARDSGWISDAELRGLLGGSYRELAALVRRHLADLLDADADA